MHYDLSTNYCVNKTSTIILCGIYLVLILSTNCYVVKTNTDNNISDLSSSHYDLSTNYYVNKTNTDNTILDLSSSHYDLSTNYYVNKTNTDNTIFDLSSSHYDLSTNYCVNKTNTDNTISDLSNSHYDLSTNYCVNKQVPIILYWIYLVLIILSTEYYVNKTNTDNTISDLSNSHYDLSTNYYVNKTSTDNTILDLSSSHYGLSTNYYVNKTNTDNNIAIIDTSVNQLETTTASHTSDIATLNTNLNTKAPLASPSLTGVPKSAYGQPLQQILHKIATTEFVQSTVANLVGSAPDALNTLNELAAAIGDDANYATTITNKLTDLDTSVNQLETSTASHAGNIDVLDISGWSTRH